MDSKPVAPVKGFFRKATILLRMAAGLSLKREDYVEEKPQLQYSVINAFQVIYLIVWLTYVALYIFYHCFYSALGSLLGAFTSLLSLIILKVYKRIFIAGLVTNFGSATAIGIITFFTGGIHSAIIIWYLPTVIGTFYQMGHRQGYAIFIYCALLALSTLLVELTPISLIYELPFLVDSFGHHVFNMYNIIFSLLSCVLIVTVFVHQFNDAYDQLKIAEEKVSLPTTTNNFPFLFSFLLAAILSIKFSAKYELPPPLNLMSKINLSISEVSSVFNTFSSNSLKEGYLYAVSLSPYFSIVSLLTHLLY